MTDARDFERLVRQHQGSVCAVAFSVLRDRGRSEEIAQEAFLVAWQKLPTMSPPPAMPGWICGIARNLARNAARRKQEVAMTDDPISTHTPLQTVLDREAGELATQALDTLAERDREVVVLYYRGDGSLADVASLLGITETAARQRLHRGRERLKTALASVEASLRATRPSSAFTATCVAALAAGVVPRADAATAAPRTVPPWTAGAIVAGAVVIGIGIATILHARSSPAASPTRIAAAPHTTVTLLPPPPDAAATDIVLRRIDAPARAALLEMIGAAHGQASSPRPQLGATSTSSERVKVYDFADSALDKPIDPPKPGTHSAKATIRYAIQLIQPLLLECYMQANPHLARKDGTISITMRLVGEPEAGTIVDSVTLGGDAHLVGDAQLAECMRETLMTVELQPPMAAPETWDVIYPFTVGR